MDPKQLEEVLSKLSTLQASIAEYGTKLTAGDAALVKIAGQVQTLEGANKTIQEQIDAVKKVQKKRGSTIMPGLEDEIEQNGAINPIEALFDPKSRSASIAREYTAKRMALRQEDGAPEVRDATSTDDNKGAVFIPNVALPGYIDKIRERSLFWRSSAGPKPTFWNNLQGFPVEIPNITDDVTVQAVGENEAPTASDIGTGLIKMEPRTLRSLTKFSKRLRRLGPTAEQAIRLSMEKQMGLKLDRMILRGLGTEKESLGLVNTPGILSVAIGANGGNWTLIQARQQKHKLRQNNQGQLPSAGFVGHPDVFYTAQTERILQYSGDTLGAYVMLPMSDEQLSAFIGPHWDTTVIPTNLVKGTNVACTEVTYGNWEDLWVGMWEDFIFKVTDQAGTSWESNQVWIMAEMEYDTQVVQPLSFVLINDASSVTL